MLRRCEETHLVLNWEKCHFMVKEGVVLGHKISKQGLEVDQVKIKAIEKMPYPDNVCGVWSFLGHGGFYRRFITEFSRIAKPLGSLLVKDSVFDFDKDCEKAFDILKRKLITAPIMMTPQWDLPFEVMCDASDYAVGAVLGQRINRQFRPIYYSSHVLGDA